MDDGVARAVEMDATFWEEDNLLFDNGGQERIIEEGGCVSHA